MPTHWRVRFRFRSTQRLTVECVIAKVQVVCIDLIDGLFLPPGQTAQRDGATKDDFWSDLVEESREPPRVPSRFHFHVSRPAALSTPYPAW
jgi:hypothetical protein